MSKVKCACGDPKCPISILVSPGDGLWLTSKDGQETLMCVDPQTITELHRTLVEYDNYIARQSGDAGYHISGELVGAPSKPLVMLQTEDAALLFLLARATLAVMLAYQQKNERLLAEPDIRQRTEQVLSRVQGLLADAGMTVKEGGGD